jgi:hypothetical protein
MSKKLILVLILIIAVAAAGWGFVRYRALQRNPHALETSGNSNVPFIPTPEAWAAAVEKVKADRAGFGAGAIETPTELQHYTDRHWFLAAQVAEIAKYSIHTCQDYVDLAAMIERGELVPVPSVTQTYVLFGVGAKADDSVFTRYEGDKSIELYSESQLNDADRGFDENRRKVQAEIDSLKAQASKLTRKESSKQKELQKQIAEREQELQSIDENKAALDEVYKQPGTRQRLMSEYQSLLALAKNFKGRSFDLDLGPDREQMKIYMLSSLRPEALKILDEVASAYHNQFDRPLPVSSLVRPEQYQHALRRVNRNAVTIDTPPHSTGLAFDIDYRYMSAAEQTFLMTVLAQIKRDGRIEVIRERNANYHVFAFVNGTRPSDDLITASLDKATEEVQETHHPPEKATKQKSASGKSKKQKNRPSTTRSKTRRKRR